VRGVVVALALTTVSTVVSTTAQAVTGDVVINEIMYHPEDDRPDGEYIELRNRSGSAVDISGWCIDGVKYCFPGGTRIAARGYIVTRSSSWDGGLKNGGEDIALLDGSGNVIDAVEYDDKGKWPANTDGNGASLQRGSGADDSQNPGNWWGNPPTPGGGNSVVSTPMPVFHDVEHTVLPAPGAPMQITAQVDGAVAVDMLYRIGFGPTVTAAVTLDGNTVSARIPGQAAGSLIRYRLRATSADGVRGVWPRQGDGAVYTGTTVSRGGQGALPRFDWFMPDDVYDRAARDLTLSGDDGYPAVFAYDGQIFDNTKVRVKGQTSRFWPKKKWKFILPDGHELKIDGVLYEDVDEFALHSNWSDKSFLRETLAAEFMERAGLPTSQAFPVQLTRNGAFYGLYTYVEQRDGTFRDRFGFDEATVYEVGGNDAFGDMQPGHAVLSQERLRRRYDKDTREYANDDALRELITALNAPPATARAYIDARVDKASVINAIAASAVIQHQDFGLKNYDLVLNEQGLWEIYPTDFDMTFGRRPSLTCGNLCDAVFTGGAFEHPAQPLFTAFWFDPELSALIRQRIRTLVEEELVPGEIDARVRQLQSLVREAADRDRSVWGTYGSSQSPSAAAADIMTRFVRPQHSRLLGPFVAQGRVAATSQPAVPQVSISDVVYDEFGGRPPHVVITNDSGRLVDLSGFEIEALDFVVRGGTFLYPGQSAVGVHDDLEFLGGLFPGLVFAGQFDEDVDDQDDGFVLTNRDGAVVDEWTLLPPGSLTVIEGRPGESAYVSIAVVRSRGFGYLQILDCDAEPGGTSNLTHDRDNQVRAGSAIVRFDDDGTLCVFNRSATHVLVDVQGYFAAVAIDDIADERLFDTRDTGGKLAPRTMTKITGRPDTSAVLSLGAVRAEGKGYVQVLPCDETPGDYSNLNVDRPNQNRTGLAIVRFGDSGELCIYNTQRMHLLADLQAYLAPDALDDIADQRLLDTRSGSRPADGSQTVITGRPGESAIVSIIAVQTTAKSYVQVLPCGATPGGSSNLNADQPRQNVSNLAIVEFDGDGRACLYTRRSAHLVVDLQAYFTPGTFDDIADQRLVDTRVD
jgi:hypothetical protein